MTPLLYNRNFNADLRKLVLYGMEAWTLMNEARAKFKDLLMLAIDVVDRKADIAGM